MTTLTIKVNEKKKGGKTFLELIDLINSKEKNVIEVIEEKSPYNPEFVKMVLKSAGSKKRYRIETDKLWETVNNM